MFPVRLELATFRALGGRDGTTTLRKPRHTRRRKMKHNVLHMNEPQINGSLSIRKGWLLWCDVINRQSFLHRLDSL